MAGGIGVVAEGIAAELGRRLPGQRKTQRNNLAMLMAVMLEPRPANLMDSIASLPTGSAAANSTLPSCFCCCPSNCRPTVGLTPGCELV